MIIGHQRQWQFLKNAWSINKLSHAYLFSGQKNLGKKFLAFELIKLLNCQNKDFTKKPCGECRNCRDIEKRVHPDVFFIGPGDKKEIQISQIRELEQHLSLRPYSASVKAAIIDESHCMNQEAQSCFLKILEEPRGRVLLILITEYPEMLLPTILSRVQKIKFFPIKKRVIENYLKNQGISKKISEEIAEFSLGRPGLMINFISDPEKLNNQTKKIKEFIKIANSNLISRFQYVKNLSLRHNDVKEIKETLDIGLNFFRNILLSQVSKKRISDDGYSLSEIKNTLKFIQKINFLISTTNINTKLALETLMLKMVKDK